jgi:hypothetical protein
MAQKYQERYLIMRSEKWFSRLIFSTLRVAKNQWRKIDFEPKCHYCPPLKPPERLLTITSVSLTFFAYDSQRFRLILSCASNR